MMMIKTLASIALNVAVIGATSYSVFAATPIEDVATVPDIHPPKVIVDPTLIYLAHIDSEEIDCLALNVYFEARNQSLRGQKAVAWVTLNRMYTARYPDTICEVVWQPRQFSWTHDGLSDVPGGNVIEDAAWEEAQQVAIDVLAADFENMQDPTRGATHYHADYVNPYWTDSYDKVASIGEHIFYK